MSRRAGLIRGWLALACLLVWLSLLVSLLPRMASSSELVRLRNALLFQPQAAEHDWSPAQRPADFAVDTAPAMPLFATVVQDRQLRQAGDWATALAIARHLLDGGKRHAEPIQADLTTSYRGIVEQGRGYCGDYADVFMALAHAAGLHSRAWAFSFDGFGGHGHIFNEIWDGQQGRWVALDVHSNQIFLGEDGRPLSAIDLRQALLRGDRPRLQPIRADVKLGFRYPDKFFEFYERGLPEWYLWWGNAVQTLDAAPLVRAAAPLGRSVEQLAAVAAGVYPRLRVLHEPGNQPQRAALASVRWRLLALLALLPAVVLLPLWWWQARRASSLLAA